jgi:hypothetical protein
VLSEKILDLARLLLERDKANHLKLLRNPSGLVTWCEKNKRNTKKKR